MIKKVLKSRIFFFMLGVLLTGGAVFAVSTISDSSEIIFNNTGTSLQSTNVEDAISELASKVDDNVCRIINLYSAPNDTIYYYKNNERIDLCTTDNSGRAVIASMPQNTTYYSSIAKDPTNLSDPYSKNITLSSNDSDVYLMPSSGDAMIYWYGYKGAAFLSNVYNSFSWRNTATNATTTVTFNDNNILFQIFQPYEGNGTHTQQVMITGTLDLSTYSHAKSIVSLSHNQSARAIITAGAPTTYPTVSFGTTPSTTAYDASLSSNIYDIDISSVSSGNIGYMQYCNGTQNVRYNMTLSASWLE